jgi:hypothetical protein
LETGLEGLIRRRRSDGEKSEDNESNGESIVERVTT